MPACPTRRRSPSAAPAAAAAPPRCCVRGGGSAFPRARSRGRTGDRRAPRARARSRSCGRGSTGEAERVGRLVADERDPPVPELEQVARRQLAAVDVVDHDARQRVVARVDEHGGDPPACSRRTSPSGGMSETISSPSVRCGSASRRNARCCRSADSTSKSARSYGDVAERRDDPANALDRRRVRQERRARRRSRASASATGSGRRSSGGSRASRIASSTRSRVAVGDVRAPVQDAGDRGDADAGMGGDIRDPGGSLGTVSMPSNLLPVATSKVKRLHGLISAGEARNLAAQWSTESGSNPGAPSPKEEL